MQFAIHKESKVRTRRVRVYAFVLAGAVALEAGVGPASAQCQIDASSIDSFSDWW